MARMAGMAVAVVLRAPTTLPAWGVARLSTQPSMPTQKIGPGLWPLGLESARDGLLLVPSSYAPGKPAPLVLVLHGATGSAQRAVERLRAYAQERGFLVLG